MAAVQCLLQMHSTGNLLNDERRAAMEDGKKYITETSFHAWARTGLLAVIALAVIFMVVRISSAIGRLTDLTATLETEVGRLREDVDSIKGRADDLLTSAQGVMTDMEQVTDEISQADIGGIMGDFEEVVKTIKEADLAAVIEDLHTAVNNLNTAVEPLARLFGGR